MRHRGPSALLSPRSPYLSVPPGTTPPEFVTASQIASLIQHPLPPSMAQQPHQVCGSCIARHAPHPWLNLSPGSTSGQGRSRRGPARRNGCRRSGCPLRLLPCHRGGEDLWYPTLGRGVIPVYSRNFPLYHLRPAAVRPGMGDEAEDVARSGAYHFGKTGTGNLLFPSLFIRPALIK